MPMNKYRAMRKYSPYKNMIAVRCLSVGSRARDPHSAQELYFFSSRFL
jgi:hypothetical protein